MADPTYPLFPVFSFLGFILVLVPMPWHLQAWNSGTCFYMFWTALGCLNQFINSIVWADNAINWSPVWCDISTRIISLTSIGIPASSLCIVKRLYAIAAVRNAQVTQAEKRRHIMLDTCICFIFPIIIVALQYIVQGHRFDIFEEVGCYPAIVNTLLTYFIFLMWQPLLGLISAAYCVMALLAFRRRQVEFNQFLSTNKSLTISRYFRLMALAMIEIMITTPVALFNIIMNLKTPLDPWVSWEDTHFNFSRVGQFPALLWRQNPDAIVSIQLTRSITIVGALIFFMFFGFAEEARKNYAAAIQTCLRVTRLDRLTKLRPSKSPLKSFALKAKLDTQDTLPTYMPPSLSSQKRPFSSYSNIIIIEHDDRSTFNGPPSPSASLPSYYEMMHTPTSSTFCPSSSSAAGLSPVANEHPTPSSTNTSPSENQTRHSFPIATFHAI
jgi:pheromone a factor receptor